MIHRFGDYELDVEQRKLRVKGEPQAIEPQVFHLLEVLIESRNRVVTRDELIDAVWQGRLVSDSTLASRIKSARQAIGDSGDRQDMIQTVYGSGYRFVGSLNPEEFGHSGAAVSNGSSTGYELSKPEPLTSTPRSSPTILSFLQWGKTRQSVRDLLARGRAKPRWQWLSVLVVGVVVPLSLVLWVARSGPERPGSMTRSSIAVLPFADMSESGDQEYFADGVAEEILNALAQVKDLRVVGRTSSFSFKGQKTDVKTIGKRLDVETVLEGSIRRVKDRVRITTQLVDTASGYHLWSETYDRQIQDIFAIQDDIAREVVQRLNLVLRDTGSERPLVGVETRDPEAYRLYLQGRYFWKRRFGDSLPQAITYFTAAIERDSNFARAHSALAASYLTLPGYTKANRTESYNTAERAARTAIQLAPNLSEPHAVLGWLYSRRLQWRRAEMWFQRAIALEPVDPVTYLWYGAHSKNTGRLRHALAQFEKALEIDPAWGVVVYNYSQMLYAMGQQDAAIKEAKRALDLDYNYAHILLRDMAYDRGELEQAVRHYGDYKRQRGYEESQIQKRLWAYRASLGLASTRAAFLKTTEEHLQSGQLAPHIAFDRFYRNNHLERALALFNPKGDPKFIRWLQKIWLPYGQAFRTHPQFATIAAELELISFWMEFGWPEPCRPDPTSGLKCQ